MVIKLIFSNPKANTNVHHFVVKWQRYQNICKNNIV